MRKYEEREDEGGETYGGRRDTMIAELREDDVMNRAEWGWEWSAVPATSDDGTSQGWRRRRHDSRKVKLGDNLGALERKKFQKSEVTMEVGGWAEVSLGFFLWKILPK